MPTEDPAALVAEARAAHEVCGGTDDCPERVCVECVEAWPCVTERLVRALEQVIKALDIPPDGTAALFFQAASESPYAAVKALKHIVGRSTAEYIAVRKQRDAARAAAAEQRARVGELERALETIRQATNLMLPSEQVGPEWKLCVRVPAKRLAQIDAAVDGALGHPVLTNEPMPALHPAPPEPRRE